VQAGEITVGLELKEDAYSGGLSQKCEKSDMRS